MCEEQGLIVPAQIVDHVKEHKGKLELFWDSMNLQSLCKQHHDRAKQRLENRGHLIGSDESGMPLDPNHAWNAA